MGYRAHKMLRCIAGYMVVGGIVGIVGVGVKGHDHVQAHEDEQCVMRMNMKMRDEHVHVYAHDHDDKHAHEDTHGHEDKHKTRIRPGVLPRTRMRTRMRMPGGG